MGAPETGDADRWNGRYAGNDYLFGVEPAEFLIRYRDLIPTRGTALCIGDGEGRNGAWLAQHGLAVTAFDLSARADAKARALDRDRGIVVARHVSGIADWEFAADGWDVVLASMVQFAAPDLRDWMFARIRETVRPGGLALVHGYTPQQVIYATGGPPNAENMYTAPMLEAAFAGWDLIVLSEYEDHLVEGTGHVGRSALIDLVARRPSPVV